MDKCLLNNLPNKETDMKKIILASLLALSLVSAAEAHGSYRMGGWHGGYYHGCGGCWVAPAVIGGVIGYELAQPNYYVQPAPVVIEQPPVVIQNSPLAPAGYHWQQMTNPQTGQLQNVLVPN
jgi:hypothetical protein